MFTFSPDAVDTGVAEGATGSIPVVIVAELADDEDEVDEVVVVELEIGINCEGVVNALGFQVAVEANLRKDSR